MVQFLKMEGMASLVVLKMILNVWEESRCHVKIVFHSRAEHYYGELEGAYPPCPPHPRAPPTTNKALHLCTSYGNELVHMYYM